MAYDPINWKNGTDTPVSAENLNHMDKGIKANDSKIINVQDAFEYNASTNALTIDLDLIKRTDV